MDVKIETLPCYVPGLPDSLNLRDMGGWPAADGRRVRHGLVYRSGWLGWQDEDGLEALGRLGLHTVLDVRSPEEAARKPDPALLDVRVLHADAGREDATEDLSEGAGFEDLVRAKLLASVRMAFSSEALPALFRLLLQDSTTPLLVHCNSGKDRTGVVMIALLVALGASDDVILADYLLSNAYRHEELAWSRTLVEDFDALPERTQQLYDIMQGVIPEACQSVLASIDASYPTREDWLQQECGLSADGIAELRKRYLE